MLKKFALSFVMLSLVIMMAGCSSMFNGPSACDDKTSPSLLCDIAGQGGVRLEGVGDLIITVNKVAVATGRYTPGQAASVLRGIRKAIDDPVSYLDLKKVIEDQVKKTPGLFNLTGPYISQFVSPEVMHEKDRYILMTWLDNRIADLEN